MPQGERPRRWPLGIVLLVVAATAVLVAWAGKPLYLLVATQRVYHEYAHPDNGAPCRGWELHYRWSQPWASAQIGRSWYVDSGYIAQDVTPEGATHFNVDGTIRNQAMYTPQRKTKPPWLWNAKNQVEPTIPTWMRNDDAWRAALSYPE